MEFRERLGSGHLVWSMKFPSEIGSDRSCIPDRFVEVPENNQSPFKSVGIGAHQVEHMNLERQLADAQETVSRIQRDRAEQQRNLQSLEAKLNLLEVATRKDAEDAILAGRKRTPKHEAEIVKIRGQVMEAEGSLETYDRVQLRALQHVEEIADSLRQQELQINRVRYAPAVRDVYAAFDVLMAACEKVSGTLEQSGPVVLEEIIFPANNLGASDFYVQQSRATMMNLYNAGTALLALRRAGQILYHPADELKAIQERESAQPVAVGA